MRQQKWAELDIACGSDAGYQRHRRRGEKPCDACRAGHAQWMARWRAQRAQEAADADYQTGASWDAHLDGLDR